MMTDAIAATVERVYQPLIGAHRVREALALAEAVMAGSSTAYVQVVSTPDGKPYMRRHYISPRWAKPQVWVHEILLPDADRYCHDHPWDYRSVILEGSYTEQTPDGFATYSAGDALERQAEDAHRLHLPAPVTTLFLVGKQRRQWGFVTAAGWMDSTTFLASRKSQAPERVF